MSEKYTDDVDWATAAEQSSEDDEAQARPAEPAKTLDHAATPTAEQTSESRKVG